MDLALIVSIISGAVAILGSLSTFFYSIQKRYLESRRADLMSEIEAWREEAEASRGLAHAGAHLREQEAMEKLEARRRELDALRLEYYRDFVRPFTRRAVKFVKYFLPAISVLGIVVFLYIHLFA
jgi:hypothetical protein